MQLGHLKKTVIMIADQPRATTKIINGINRFIDTKITGKTNQNNFAVIEDASQ